MPRFATLADLNDWLEQRYRALWQEIPHGHHSGSVADAWASEAGSLYAMHLMLDAAGTHHRKKIADFERAGCHAVHSTRAPNISDARLLAASLRRGVMSRLGNDP
jgi:hypothetical protein